MAVLDTLKRGAAATAVIAAAALGGSAIAGAATGSDEPSPATADPAATYDVVPAQSSEDARPDERDCPKEGGSSSSSSQDAALAY